MTMYDVRMDLGAFFALTICATLLIFIKCMRSFDGVLRTQFQVMIYALIFACLSHLGDVILVDKGLSSNLRYITAIINEISEGFLAYQALLIVESKCGTRRKIAYGLPFVISSLVILASPFFDTIFYYDEANNFIRGNLGYLIYAEGLAYAFEIVFVCYRKWIQGAQKDAIIIIVVIVEEIIAVFLDEKNLIHCAVLFGAAVGICFLYMYMYAVRFNVDSVSNCFKRRCFYSDGVRYGGHTMAIISMDLNDLKLINDNYGHKAGDKALLDFADICRAAKTKKFILYRTGGDEFMMLGIRATKDEADEVVENIKKRLASTSYSCSFGVVMYRAGDDFDEIVVKADKAMYADKKEYKKNNKRSHSRYDDFEMKHKKTTKAE